MQVEISVPLAVKARTSSQQKPRTALRPSTGAGCRLLGRDAGGGLAGAGLGSTRRGAGGETGRDEEPEPPYCQASTPSTAAKTTPTITGQRRSQASGGRRLRSRSGGATSAGSGAR